MDYIKTNSTNFIKEYKKNLSDKDTANSLDLSLNNFKSIVETLISKGKLNRRLKIFDEKKFLNMQKEWEELPETFVTSSEKKMGTQEIADYIEKLNPHFKEAR